MQWGLTMKFTKMHGAGNDYIFIDCFQKNVENPEELSKTLSQRHFGIGADGIVLIKPSIIADCSMNIYNADGSEAEMCGNAIRCVAKYIFDNRIKRDKIKIDTLSGVKVVHLHVKDGKAVGGTVNMGRPILNGRQIPTRYGMSVVKDQIINIENKDYKITCVGMGNPHCVVFCDDVDKLDLSKIGPLFEHHEMFPERINTEFAEIIDENNLKMRVWERGSGETLACGTGACAAAVAAVENGYCNKNEDITVKLRGGDLIIRYTDDAVYMTGNAEKLFEGEILI
jgi:diaminopimelate epimerase